MQYLRMASPRQQVTGSSEDEPKCFLIWIGVWVLALAILLPTLG